MTFRKIVMLSSFFFVQSCGSASYTDKRQADASLAEAEAETENASELDLRGLPNLEGDRMIRVSHSGHFVDVAGVGQEDGTPVVQWPYHGGANQRFKFVAAGPAGRRASIYQIRALHTQNKCLTVDSTSVNTALRISECASAAGVLPTSQMFRVVDKVADRWAIKPVISGGYNKCLAIADANKNQGAYVTQQPCNGRLNQRFVVN
jgi:hypothetical protein